MKKTKNILLTLGVIGFMALAQLSFVPLASAGLFDDAKNEACGGAQLSGTATNCDGANTGKLDSTVQNIIDLISVIVGVVAVIMIIVNGLKFITSGGDSNKVGSAKNGIIYAVVGLIIVALAQIIVKFVIAKV